jgi:Flp pilus assembly protein TadB
VDAAESWSFPRRSLPQIPKFEPTRYSRSLRTSRQPENRLESMLPRLRTAPTAASEQAVYRRAERAEEGSMLVVLLIIILILALGGGIFISKFLFLLLLLLLVLLLLRGRF